MKKIFLICGYLCCGLSFISIAQNVQIYKDISFYTVVHSGDTPIGVMRAESLDEYEVLLEKTRDGGSSTFIRLKENVGDSKIEVDAENKPTMANGATNSKDTLILVYPNPVTNYWTVVNKTSSTIDIVIFNSSGNQINRFEAIGKAIEIPKQKLGRGIIIYHVLQNGKLLKEGRISVE